MHLTAVVVVVVVADVIEIGLSFFPRY